MPVLDEPPVELVEGVEPASDDLRLFESVQLTEGVQADGTVVLDLIRPCVGRGRGRHLYRAEMLEANAGVFTGWKMYLNHLSEAARRALGGLPRDVRDVGGIVVESWWNPDVPAEGRFQQGAVQGRVKPTPLVQELIRTDPRLVEASINATASGVKAGKVGNERVWIVEGIEGKGSVDWVTDGGAGGRVAQIMEAMIEDGSAVSGALDDLDNGTILAWLEEHRPELTEAMKSKKDPDGDGDDDTGADTDDDDDLAAEAKRHKARNPKLSDEAATAMARQSLKRKAVKETTSQEDDLPEITTEALVEAFASDEGRQALTEALGPAVADAVRSLDLGGQVSSLVESTLDRDREVIRAEATATAERHNELRDLRDHAHRKIDESRLADSLKERLKAEFAIVEGAPTAALDLVEDEDETGKVVKSAQAKLEEALKQRIDDGFALMAELNPTRVRGQGPSRIVEGEGSGGSPEKVDATGPRTRSLLEAAGVKIPAAKADGEESGPTMWDGRFSLGGR